MSIEDKLKSLGDPSGQQTAEYWNEWFSIICADNNGDHEHQKKQQNLSEWYCHVEEVSRILQRHICSAVNYKDSTHNHLKFIHPGSGNSKVPHHLFETFPKSHHTILDISDVALVDIREEYINHNSIECEAANILDPPINHPNESFDIWIDKGLLDALFSNHEQVTEDQCHSMFQEAHRLLRSPEDEMSNNRLMMIISMAEDHSLNLILKNWLDYQHVNGVDVPMWSSTLHIYETQPSTGSMIPFGFILEKMINIDIMNKNGTLLKPKRTIQFHSMNDDSIPSIQIPNDASNTNILFTSTKEVVKNLLAKSRDSYITQLNARKTTNEPLLLGTMEIKPCSSDVDLQQLCYRIISINHQSRWWLPHSATDQMEADTSTSYSSDSVNKGRNGPIHLQWYPNDEQSLERINAHENANMKRVGIHGIILPIGYGIHKLVLRCTIGGNDTTSPNSSLEGLADFILEKEEDSVQSVDIVWEETRVCAS